MSIDHFSAVLVVGCRPFSIRMPDDDLPASVFASRDGRTFCWLAAATEPIWFPSRIASPAFAVR